MTDYTHVLYHAGCQDGFSAAWAAWLKLKEKAQYIPIHFGDPFPELYKDSRVIMLDIAYSRERHEELVTHVESLTVVDHHQTALDNLGKLPNVHIDLNHSGAVLAWNHFFDHPPPRMLLYIEDYDLWRFKLLKSREVSAAFSSYSRTFEEWSRMASIDMGQHQQDGAAVLRFMERNVEILAKRAFWMKIDGHEVPVVNLMSYKNEVAERLNAMYPDAPFAAVYFELKDIRCWSLRSQGKIDVAAIAKKFGGGGHPNSAGFSESIHKKREDK
jgi:oligoribonuclease NrnB/cAMP/cGMP phosphodiesterase (DHH superfamily)